MSYIIYHTIDEGTFINLHARIAVLKKPFQEFLSGYGFTITSESDLVDILGLDFISYSDHYDGNIGFLFDDESPRQTFTFYVLKSYDDKSRRYSKKVEISKAVELGYIEENYPSLLNKAIKTYKETRDDELADITELR